MLAAAEADQLLEAFLRVHLAPFLRATLPGALNLSRWTGLPQSASYPARILEAPCRVIELTPRVPQNIGKRLRNQSKQIRTFHSINNTLRRLRLPKVTIYCFVFFRICTIFRDPWGKREISTWQSHVPADTFLRQLDRVSASLLKHYLFPPYRQPRIPHPPVKGTNLTASSRLGWPSPQMVSYHFLRQTRGHHATTAALRFTFPCAKPHRILPRLPHTLLWLSSPCILGNSLSATHQRHSEGLDTLHFTTRPLTAHHRATSRWHDDTTTPTPEQCSPACSAPRWWAVICPSGFGPFRDLWD